MREISIFKNASLVLFWLSRAPVSVLHAFGLILTLFNIVLLCQACLTGHFQAEWITVCDSLMSLACLTAEILLALNRKREALNWFVLAVCLVLSVFPLLLSFVIVSFSPFTFTCAVSLHFMSPSCLVSFPFKWKNGLSLITLLQSKQSLKAQYTTSRTHQSQTLLKLCVFCTIHT